jgi:photosystem II stability/assembly factor-like uncharacterized protein
MQGEAERLGGSGVRTCIAVVLVLAGIAFSGCSPARDTVVAIALHPMDERIAYVVTHQGVFKTMDMGGEWRKVFTHVTQSRVLAVAIDQARPSTVYLGTKDDGMYVSYDGGRHWFSRRAGLDDVRVTAEVQQIIVMPGQPSRVFLATALGVFESDDEGESWRKRMAGITAVLMVTSLAVDPMRPGVMYAGTSAGIYKTTDRAQTWNPSSTGLIPLDRVVSSRSFGVTALALDPRRPETVYTGTLVGLFKSVNGGQSWTRIGEYLSDRFINAVLVDPVRSDVVYIGGTDGIFMSRDGGLTWEPRSAGLESRHVLALVASPVKPGLMYAGTNGGGLYRTQNGAVFWERVPLWRK